MIHDAPLPGTATPTKMPEWARAARASVTEREREVLQLFAYGYTLNASPGCSSSPRRR